MLNTLAEIVFIAALTAAFSHFLAFCLREGNILGAYGTWIEKKSENPKLEYWLKPLGGCIFCAGTWIFICTYLMLGKTFPNDPLKIIGLFLGCGVNYLFIELYSKIIE